MSEHIIYYYILVHFITFLCLLLDARIRNCIVTRLQRAGRLARQLKLLSFSLRAPAFAEAVVTCCDILGRVFLFTILIHPFPFPHLPGEGL